jgi:uncharacterized membrane protein
MSKLEDFLSVEDEEKVVEAIRLAEAKTSGEIRVHIERNCPKDIFERTTEVFHSLEMDKTKQRNGVLIYVAIENKSFVIFGDEGINNVIDSDFWNTSRDLIASHFKMGDFAKGLIEGIEKAGKELSQYFPWSQGDTNELENTISKS